MTTITASRDALARVPIKEPPWAEMITRTGDSASDAPGSAVKTRRWMFSAAAEIPLSRERDGSQRLVCSTTWTANRSSPVLSASPNAHLNAAPEAGELSTAATMRFVMFASSVDDSSITRSRGSHQGQPSFSPGTKDPSRPSADTIKMRGAEEVPLADPSLTRVIVLPPFRHQVPASRPRSTNVVRERMRGWSVVSQATLDG
jgi:hypothetical protein